MWLWLLLLWLLLLCSMLLLCCYCYDYCYALLLAFRGHVELSLPSCYSAKMRQDLISSPTSVALCQHCPYFYLLVRARIWWGLFYCYGYGCCLLLTASTTSNYYHQLLPSITILFFRVQNSYPWLLTNTCHYS